jgi:NADH-quinone oxidoreductase subunit N
MTPFAAPTIPWEYLVPILVVLGTGVIGVLVEAFVPAALRRPVQVTLALAALVVSAIMVVVLWQIDAVHAPSAAGSAFTGVSILNGALSIDPLTLLFWGVIVILAFLSVLVIADRTGGQDAFTPAAASVPGSAYEELARRKHLEHTEVFPLVLFSTGGMMIFPATGNLLVMFIALEVLSLPLYVLTAMARRRRLLSQEAAFKYFMLGAFASALFLFGIALLYGFSGSVKLYDIGGAIANTDLSGAHPSA